MTQFEFDAQMRQMNYEQMLANQQYNAQKEELDKKINDHKLAILMLRRQIQELHIQKLAIQSEQKKMNQERHEQKHQFVVAHPRESMEPVSAQQPPLAASMGHAVHDDVAV